MCFSVVSSTRTLIKYAKHRKDDPLLIEELEKKLEHALITLQSHHFVSGFAHPELLIFANDKPFEPQTFQWGLIPFWTKDLKAAQTIANQTLNARSETIFEKPAFREAAKGKRCLIYIDAFYEYHHFKGKTFPFHIAMKDGAPLSVAGLWDEWVDKETGEIHKTVSIVTCEANSIMARIHNNPKAEGARMPVILSREDQDKWLSPLLNKEELIQLAKPFPEELLEYHTVKRILGKDGIGDVPEAEEKFVYQDFEINL